MQSIKSIPESTRNTFVTSMDISSDDHVKMQASFQAYCDNAISKTINFPNSATIEDVTNAYLLAWKLGCKGCTVYRDGSRTLQILNLNGNDEKEEADEKKTFADSSNSPNTHLSSSSEDNIISIAEVQHVDSPCFSRESCPECEKYTLVADQGCSKCVSCGFSFCSKN